MSKIQISPPHYKYVSIELLLIFLKKKENKIEMSGTCFGPEQRI